MPDNASPPQPSAAPPSSRDTEADAWLLIGDLPCLDCSYNLRGLVGPVVMCPECGRHNDLQHPQQWEKNAVPTGVREREHWPSVAVLWSILSVGIMLPVITIVCAPVTLVAWGYYCWKWIDSSQRKVWAVGVLAAAHVALWSTFIGIISFVGLSATGNLAFVPIGLACVGLGVGGVFWLRKEIARADKDSQFRQDWRQFRINIADSSVQVHDPGGISQETT